jgi:hypothetical protein
MRVQLRGGHSTQDRRLDRLPQKDPRNLSFPLRALLPEDTTQIIPKYWLGGTLIDQGQEGACVGFGVTGELMASPVRTHIGPEWKTAYSREDPNVFARGVYKRAQQLDPWAGEDYEGTSVLAGMKAAMELGLITEYRWGFSLNDVRDTLMYYGPVIIGVNWYDSMYETDAQGLVTVDGELVGGHCILLTGYSPARKFADGPKEVYRWRNSWGPYYGYRGTGHGFVTAEDMHRLLIEEGGDMVVPVKRVSGNV